MDKPTIGRIVHYRGPESITNISDVAPAIVTKVHSDTCVNLTVFPDAGQPRWVTSVCHADMKGDRQWFWPPREPAA